MALRLLCPSLACIPCSTRSAFRSCPSYPGFTLGDDHFPRMHPPCAVIEKLLTFCVMASEVKMQVVEVRWVLHVYFILETSQKSVEQPGICFAPCFSCLAASSPMGWFFLGLKLYKRHKLIYSHTLEPQPLKPNYEAVSSGYDGAPWCPGRYNKSTHIC